MPNLPLTSSSIPTDSSPSLDDILYMVNDPAGAKESKKITVDSLRLLLEASKPKAKMTRDAAQSIPNGVTTKVSFDNEAFDVGGLASIATGKFTIQEDGYYLVTAFCRIPGVDDGEVNALFIYKNGATILDAGNQSPAADKSIDVTLCDVFSLSAGDYLELYVYQNSGDAQDTSTDTAHKPRMSVVKI